MHIAFRLATSSADAPGPGPSRTGERRPTSRPQSRTEPNAGWSSRCYGYGVGGMSADAPCTSSHTLAVAGRRPRNQNRLIHSEVAQHVRGPVPHLIARHVRQMSPEHPHRPQHVAEILGARRVRRRGERVPLERGRAEWRACLLRGAWSMAYGTWANCIFNDTTNSPARSLSENRTPTTSKANRQRLLRTRASKVLRTSYETRWPIPVAMVTAILSTSSGGKRSRNAASAVIPLAAVCMATTCAHELTKGDESCHEKATAPAPHRNTIKQCKTKRDGNRLPQTALEVGGHDARCLIREQSQRVHKPHSMDIRPPCTASHRAAAVPCLGSRGARRPTAGTWSHSPWRRPGSRSSTARGPSPPRTVCSFQSCGAGARWAWMVEQ
jgi:hypothetical protein